MATTQTRTDDASMAEFVLAGRYWLNTSVAAVCFAAAIYLHVTRDHPWVGLHSLPWRAAGISLEERQNLFTAGFAVLALACVIWALIGPRVARRIVITSTNVIVYAAQFGSSEPVVIPFGAIRDAGQRELPSRRGRSEFIRRADPYFHFSFNGRDFDFRRLAFQSNRDFERFCQIMASRAGHIP